MSLAEFIDEIRPAWMREAACKGKGPIMFDRRNALPAKNVCASCTVVDPCLAFALADPGLQGVWGGTTEADRDRLRERNAT